MSFFSKVEKNIEREFRKWTEKVFGPAESDDLLLIHRAILEEIETKVQTLRRGERIFPYNRLVVRLFSSDASRRQLFEAAFSQLENDVSQCLEAAGCKLPAGFTVNIETAEAGQGQFQIDYLRTTQERPAQARLAVIRGKANQDEFVLQKARTNIGRMVELTDSRHRLIRRNDIVFEDSSDVSRGHAHIVFDAQTWQYSICDDGSEFGTRVFRDGRSIEVPPNGQRGERLRPGDEIYLGRACLRFDVGQADSPPTVSPP